MLILDKDGKWKRWGEGKGCEGGQGSGSYTAPRARRRGGGVAQLFLSLSHCFAWLALTSTLDQAVTQKASTQMGHRGVLLLLAAAAALLATCALAAPPKASGHDFRHPIHPPQHAALPARHAGAHPQPPPSCSLTLPLLKGRACPGRPTTPRLPPLPCPALRRLMRSVHARWASGPRKRWRTWWGL